jgi:hypothetical protein
MKIKSIIMSNVTKNKSPKHIKGVFNTKARRLLFLSFNLALILSLSLLCFPFVAAGDSDDDGGNGTAASTLAVKVGYSGQTPDTKKEYSIDQLMALGTRNQTFSWITQEKGMVIQTTRGVPLKKILSDAGIDIASVARIHFTSSDGNETKELTAGYLFSERRYYYPNLIKAWDFDTGKAGPDADKGKVAVETVLAVQDYWKKYTSNDDEPVLYDNMTQDKRLRLCFGMTDTVKATSSNGAKWIHSIEVTLAGKPPKDKAKNDKDKKAGSTKGDKLSPSKKKSNDKKTTSGAVQQAPTAVTSPVVPPIAPPIASSEAPPPTTVGADATSGVELRELDTEGMGMDATVSDGYQPWRISELSVDGEPNAAPPANDSSMAGPTAGVAGGCIAFGGLLHFLALRRIWIFKFLR